MATGEVEGTSMVNKLQEIPVVSKLKIRQWSISSSWSSSLNHRWFYVCKYWDSGEWYGKSIWTKKQPLQSPSTQ